MSRKASTCAAHIRLAKMYHPNPKPYNMYSTPLNLPLHTVTLHSNPSHMTYPAPTLHTSPPPLPRAPVPPFPPWVDPACSDLWCATVSLTFSMRVVSLMAGMHSVSVHRRMPVILSSLHRQAVCDLVQVQQSKQLLYSRCWPW